MRSLTGTVCLVCFYAYTEKIEWEFVETFPHSVNRQSFFLVATDLWCRDCCSCSESCSVGFIFNVIKFDAIPTVSALSLPSPIFCSSHQDNLFCEKKIIIGNDLFLSRLPAFLPLGFSIDLG